MSANRSANSQAALQHNTARCLVVVYQSDNPHGEKAQRRYNRFMFFVKQMVENTLLWWFESDVPISSGARCILNTIELPRSTVLIKNRLGTK